MKTQKHKIFGCLLLIGAIVVSVGFALPAANAGFGEPITTAQMANMFGGGFVFCNDRDCDTASGGCPGGSTTCGTEPEDNGTLCTQCNSGAGKVCGEAGGPGWQCVSSTESCNGNKGYCVQGSCERRASDQTTPSCGSKPDC